jgi:hypothetical protein
MLRQSKRWAALWICALLLLSEIPSPALATSPKVGAAVNIQLESEEVVAAAHYAVAFLNAQLRDEGTPYGLVEISRGTQQVVAGITYDLFLKGV